MQLTNEYTIQNTEHFNYACPLADFFYCFLSKF